jgi:hypothetical protein
LRAVYPPRGLLRLQVRDPQHHVGVTRLVDCALAGEIFVVRTLADVASENGWD